MAETAASNGHPLAVIVEKAEEAALPPSAEPDINATVFEATAPNPPTSEPDVSVPAQTVDVSREDLPISIVVERDTLVEISEPSTTEPTTLPSVKEINLGENLELALHDETVNSAQISFVAPQIIPEESKEETAKAEATPMPAMEPAVTQTTVAQPSVPKASVDVPNINIEELTPEVVVEMAIPIEVHQETIISNEKEVGTPIVNEESSGFEPHPVVAEVSPKAVEVQDVAGESIAEKAGVATDQDTAVEHSVPPEESADIVEHSTRFSEEIVASGTPLVEEPAVETQPTAAEEPPSEGYLTKAESFSEKPTTVDEPVTVERSSTEQEAELTAQGVLVPKEVATITSEVEDSDILDEAASITSHTLAHEQHATAKDPVNVSLDQPEGVEEPVIPAAVEDSVGAQAALREDMVEETAEVSAISEESNKIEDVTSEVHEPGLGASIGATPSSNEDHTAEPDKETVAEVVITQTGTDGLLIKHEP
jgi:hypothetical protein